MANEIGGVGTTISTERIIPVFKLELTAENCASAGLTPGDEYSVVTPDGYVFKGRAPMAAEPDLTLDEAISQADGHAARINAEALPAFHGPDDDDDDDVPVVTD